jgi:hypothetical protein
MHEQANIELRQSPPLIRLSLLFRSFSAPAVPQVSINGLYKGGGMNVLLVGSEKDVSLALQLQQALVEAGYSASSFHPDLGSDATLPAHAIRVMQGADYFLYLVTEHSANETFVRMLTPENIAPLCSIGVKIILIVANSGSLPPELAYLPCLYFLDEEMTPTLVNGFVKALTVVDTIQTADLYDLRYGSRDLEAFLETAQGLAMAYTGIESAWDEMQEHDAAHARLLFERYSSDVSFGVNFISRVRLETRASQQVDYAGPITNILASYEILERDWLTIEMSFNASDTIRESIMAARCRTAVFINLIYLIMALKLQPYCDQYLHMHGLKQKQEMSAGPDQPFDAAQERLSFLMASAKKRK